MSPSRDVRTGEQSSPEERERKAREESLRLSRARLEEQLRRATNPAHRAKLECALKALERSSFQETGWKIRFRVAA